MTSWPCVCATTVRRPSRVLALIQHPNIVSVYRLSLLDAGWAVAMERVRGADLAALVEGRGPLPVGAALEIVAQVAGGLRFAWSQTGPDGRPLHAVHRDIKPENLRLSEHGIVKVLDFGIARATYAARESRTALDRVPGTLRYMAPELFTGQQGPAGDIYALGGVLYALLAGEVLGPAREEEEAHDAWLRKRMSRLAEARADLDQDVLLLLYSLLRYLPEDRPDAAALERSARTMLRDHPSQALADLAPGWLATLASAAAAPDAGDAVVGTLLRELSASSVAQTDVSGLVDPETVFSPLPVPEPPGQVQRAALVPVSTDGAVGRRSSPTAPSPWERITWGHVATFVLLLVLGFGAAASALLRAEPATAPEAAPLATPAAPTEAVAAMTEPAAAKEEDPPSETVLVQVSGDAELVELVRGGRRVRLPARVSPGVWSMEVRFPGSAVSRDKGAVTVRPGLRIRCDSDFMTCEW